MSALVDSGSDLDIVSANFMQQHGLQLDSSERTDIQLPNKVISSLGTITLPFSPDGETSIFHRKFYVLPSCTHDVILGHRFLKATQMLTKFAHCLRAKFTPRPYGPRIRLIGSPKQRIAGAINGCPVKAVPDTGSDVMLMSWRQARKLRLHVLTGSKYRTRLEFADGSTALTHGIVFNVNLRFGGANAGNRICNFHIMKRLPCDIILSNEFIYQSNALRLCEQIMSKDYGKGPSDAYQELNLVREIVSRGRKRSWINRAFGLFKPLCRSTLTPSYCVTRIIDYSTTASNSAQPQILTEHERVRRELQRQEQAEAVIAALSQNEQQAAWEVERSRREQWVRNQPPIPSSPPSNQVL